MIAILKNCTHYCGEVYFRGSARRAMKKYLLKMYNMKKILPVLTVLLFIQCSSVKKQNAQLDVFISVEKMKQDVDYTYQKLQQLHPNLYGYIDKSVLDYKFDSLKLRLLVH
jgi:hypothetical protein